jgi:hypothetical protein
MPSTEIIKSKGAWSCASASAASRKLAIKLNSQNSRSSLVIREDVRILIVAKSIPQIEMRILQSRQRRIN